MRPPKREKAQVVTLVAQYHPTTQQQKGKINIKSLSSLPNHAAKPSKDKPFVVQNASISLLAQNGQNFMVPLGPNFFRSGHSTGK
jgi:hypothetical protein